ncbi:hypothetical protein V2J09_007406 [Rumex salicifolius]
MPPRTRKPAGTPPTRRTQRATRAASSTTEPMQNLSETVADEAKVDPVSEEVAAEEKAYDNATDLNVELTEEPNSDHDGSYSEKKKDEVKDPVDEYERGERLDLEDNEVEYETEEYVGVDYDEKDIDQEGIQEEGDEDVEEIEEDVIEEEEVETGEEDMDNIQEEELEGEDDDEHAGEGQHAEFVDAAEENEHHEVVKERRKRKEFEVFVGGLDKDATEEDLREVFNVAGKIIEVRLMKNPQTRKNKGFAFLRFATIEQARRAVTELKNPVVNGKQCGVSPSQDSDTLFLGNICKTWTREALEKKLKHYGVEYIEDITLVEDSNNPGINRGFAFLEFSSRVEAMDAYKRLQKRDVVFGVERPAKVSFADSFIDPGDEIMAQVKTVFVDGIPASWDEDRVREFLKKYGHIEKIELARNMPSARRKDFGFVSFDTHEAAVICAKSINNAELGEGDIKVKVRARLSRPLQRSKSKQLSRGRRMTGHAHRAPWNRPLPRPLPPRGGRKVGNRPPPVSERMLKRPSGSRDRRAAIAQPPRSIATAPRARPLPPPPRSYERRAPVPSYPKSSTRRGYPRRDEIPPRSRASAEYGSRMVDRHTSYRDDYSTRSSYPEIARSGSDRAAPRRVYQEDAYGPRYDRPPPNYHEGRPREYDSISGSKRPYGSLDEVTPRYTDAGVRHSRARLDYDIVSGSSQYGDTYSDRLGRPSVAYGDSRTSLSSQDTHGLYGSRQGMSYGSYGNSDVRGAYSSSFDRDYPPRGSDVGGSSYSSMYSSRDPASSGYMGSSSSRSYY